MNQDISVYCKNKYGKQVLVGVFMFNLSQGKYTFMKNGARLMRRVGDQGGYGIQRHVLTKEGKKQDILEMFKKHPETTIFIHDVDTDKRYTADAKEWVDHSIQADYGNGSQLFLCVERMNPVIISINKNE